MEISESGMLFGDYRPEQLFRIENSDLHMHIKPNVKTVEFILLRNEKDLLFVEAKSSSPKAETDLGEYQKFLNKIIEKFICSFNMLCAWRFGRLEDTDEIGSDIKGVNFKDAKFVFILVINGHKKEWLLPLQDELKQKMRNHRAIWNSQVVVMNEEIARERHLVR